MLVLSRKKGQSIKIGAGVVVTVCGVDRGKVRIGITAPGEIEVDRAEVKEAKGRAQGESETQPR